MLQVVFRHPLDSFRSLSTCFGKVLCGFRAHGRLAPFQVLPGCLVQPAACVCNLACALGWNFSFLFSPQICRKHTRPPATHAVLDILSI